MEVSDSVAKQYELSDPDVRLMIRVRDDDAEAFTELVERYQARVMTILEHLVRRREQAEDLAQEVFLRVFRARKSYQPGAKFSTWLFTIANNVASNANRSHHRRKEVQMAPRQNDEFGVQTLEQMAAAKSGLQPTRQMDHLERAEVVRMAIQSLNERQRMALLLSKFEGMSYAEIAEAMDLSTQAIKSLLSRARNNLKDILTPYMAEGVPPNPSASSVERP